MMAEKNTWKTIAITFVLLFVLAIILLTGVFSTDYQNEKECKMICADVEGAVSYFYNNQYQACICLDANGNYLTGQLSTSHKLR